MMIISITVVVVFMCVCCPYASCAEENQGAAIRDTNIKPREMSDGPYTNIANTDAGRVLRNTEAGRVLRNIPQIVKRSAKKKPVKKKNRRGGKGGGGRSGLISFSSAYSRFFDKYGEW